MMAPPRSVAEINLDALRHNLRLLRQAATGAACMAVVKADAYGHGIVPVAQTARAEGIDWLGVALPDEALALRAAGDTGRMLTWLSVPGQDYEALIAADIDVSAYNLGMLNEISGAAQRKSRPARVHLKIDTGLSRGGATEAQWPPLCQQARRLEQQGVLQVVGVWSHFAYADEPGNPTIAAQLRAFEQGCQVAERAGLRPEFRHIANSAATLTLPQAHFDLVRPGIACYGISPGEAVGTEQELGLRPVMTLTATPVLTKRLPAGVGISYGHTYHTDGETTAMLIPLGYADGIPRNASNKGPVFWQGQRYRIAGRVCMDQFVVDVGQAAESDERVVLFGDPNTGVPSAADWAHACDTIAYEIVTRIGPRVPRTLVGDTSQTAS